MTGHSIFTLASQTAAATSFKFGKFSNGKKKREMQTWKYGSEESRELGDVSTPSTSLASLEVLRQLLSSHSQPTRTRLLPEYGTRTRQAQ
jgi:hypothetical protein